ncbi:MAG TPA: peptidoglycan DD-metalloendopeptidase family protein [Acidimicrobiales bacterium]
MVGVVVTGLALVVLGWAVGGGAAAAQEGGVVVHEPPVAAPVRDPFRPPATPYGPGNRGIEYATVPGTVVRATAEGQVTFAGQVGGRLHVTIAHADGIRTSYSGLRRIDVRLGQVVRRGAVVGRAGGAFHLGARRGDAYVDPASLFAAAPDTGRPGRGELLPLEVPPGGRPPDAPDAVVHGRPAWGGALDGDVVAAGLGRALAQGPEADAGDVEGLVRPGALALATRHRLERHYAVEAHPVVRAVEVSRGLADRLDAAASAPCSHGPAPTRPVAGQRRRALLVGGLGSSSRSASVDRLRTDALGYAPDAVERFSYTLDGRPYTSPDTQGRLVAAGQRLAATIARLAEEHPGATLDLYAHSMGGVVTRLALLDLAQQGFDLGRLGIVVTMGSPHQGADLATAVAAANTGLVGNVELDVVEELVDTGLDPDGAALAELSATSPVVTMLREVGPPPPGVRLVSIAASGDVVVPLPNTQVDGARHVVVSLSGRHAHGDLVAHPETTGEIARALAGQPPRCEAPEEVIEEHLLGHGISYLEDLAGFTALSGTR